MQQVVDKVDFKLSYIGSYETPASRLYTPHR